MGVMKKLLGLARYGTVYAANDGEKRQALQLSLLDGEVAENVPHYMNYGFSSVAMPISPNGQAAEAVVVAPGGASSKRAAVVVDDRRYRPNRLEFGEVTVYTHRDDPSADADSALHRITLDSSADQRTISRCGATTIEQVASGEITVGSTGGNINLNPNEGDRVIVTEMLRLPVRTTKELEALTGEPGEVCYCVDGNGGQKCLAAWNHTDLKWHVIPFGGVIDDLIP